MTTKSCLAAAGLCLAIAAPLSAHEGDPKAIHRMPGRAGAGFQNATLRNPALLDLEDPNVQLSLGGFGAERVTLLSWLTLSDFGVSSSGNGNSLWGYTSAGGRRYALMGHSDGLAFVEITVPTSPVIVTQIGGPSSLWRDVRVFGDHAYAVSEGGGGIQVFDLSLIDSGIVSLVGNVDDDSNANTHTVAIDEVSGFLYRSGGGGGGTDYGLRIYDLNANPANPPRVGTWNDRYVHEVSVFTLTTGPNAGDQVAFACGGFNGGFSQSGLMVLDVTTKSSIQTLDIQSYPGAAYCHQGWLSADEQYFYINDEFWNGPSTTVVMDVSNPGNVSFASTFTSGNNAVAHNLYVFQGHMYASSYTSGLRVWDLANPTAPTEVAWFDTFPEGDPRVYNSLWNNYPFFGNGLVIGSDIEKGLFVWYVGDPKLTFTLPQGVPIAIDPGGSAFEVQISEATPGNLQAGSARLHFDTGTGFVSAPLADQGGGSFLAQLPALPCGTEVDFYVSADSTDGTVWTDPRGAPVHLHEGVVASTLTTVIDDDFETDQGWTTSVAGASAGQWQRGVPVDDPSWAYDPEVDGDHSGQAFLTQNEIGNTDVDGGSVLLVSPTLDLSGGDARIRYRYYLNLTAVDGIDALTVEIDANDGAGPWTEIARHFQDTAAGLVSTGWVEHTVEQSDLDTAGVVTGATMRVRFTANDSDPQSVVEAGVDGFFVETYRCTGQAYCAGDGTGGASCPCGNAGNTGHGCDNAQGTGGVRVSGTGDPAQNNVVLVGEGFPAAASPSVVGIRSPAQENPPVVFGDGLRCISAGGLVRFGATAAAGGSSLHPVNHGAGPGTFYYQLWYRNNPGTFCNPEGFNLSNGYQITWP